MGYAQRRTGAQMVRSSWQVLQALSVRSVAGRAGPVRAHDADDKRPPGGTVRRRHRGGLISAHRPVFDPQAGRHFHQLQKLLHGHLQVGSLRPFGQPRQQLGFGDGRYAQRLHGMSAEPATQRVVGTRMAKLAIWVSSMNRGSRAIRTVRVSAAACRPCRS